MCTIIREFYFLICMYFIGIQSFAPFELSNISKNNQRDTVLDL